METKQLIVKVAEEMALSGYYSADREAFEYEIKNAIGYWDDMDSNEQTQAQHTIAECWINYRMTGAVAA